MNLTYKQKKVVDALSQTGIVREVAKIVNLTNRETNNLLLYLYNRGTVKRIQKGEYAVNHEEPRAVDVKPLEIDGKTVDLNQIPEKVREYLWDNRQMPCSQLRSITKLPRLYIRQYIYERKMKEYQQGMTKPF